METSRNSWNVKAQCAFIYELQALYVFSSVGSGVVLFLG